MLFNVTLTLTSELSYGESKNESITIMVEADRLIDALGTATDLYKGSGDVQVTGIALSRRTFITAIRNYDVKEANEVRPTTKSAY